MQRFSCVIIEPTYDHEREGRGNFVQEGKSGELASPPSLTQHARTRLLLLPTDSAQQAASRSSSSRASGAYRPDTRLPLWCSPFRQPPPRALAHLVAVRGAVSARVSAAFQPRFTASQARHAKHRLCGAKHRSCFFFFSHRPYTGWQVSLSVLSLLSTLTRPHRPRSLSLALYLSKLGSELTLHSFTPKEKKTKLLVINRHCLRKKERKKCSFKKAHFLSWCDNPQ